MDNLTREQILEERKEWYSKIFVLLEIVKCLHHRELCFLSQKGEEPKKAVRYLLAFNLDYWKKHTNWINFNKSLLNVYHSVAFFKPNVPCFSYNLKERKNEEKYQEFNKNYEQYVQGYDFFIDLDGKQDFEKCYAEAKEIKKIFDEYHLPYYLMNSSFKGFHFHIPCQYLPNYPIKELIDITYKVMYNFKGIYDFSSIDVLNDLKRVCKVPYSYVGDGSICLPLSDTQFNFYKQSDVIMQSVMKNVRIKNRGLLTRHLELGEEQLKKNVLKFINDFK